MTRQQPSLQITSSEAGIHAQTGNRGSTKVVKRNQGVTEDEPSQVAASLGGKSSIGNLKQPMVFSKVVVRV